MRHENHEQTKSFLKTNIVKPVSKVPNHRKEDFKLTFLACSINIVYLFAKNRHYSVETRDIQ